MAASPAEPDIEIDFSLPNLDTSVPKRSSVLPAAKRPASKPAQDAPSSPPQLAVMLPAKRARVPSKPKADPAPAAGGSADPPPAAAPAAPAKRRAAAASPAGGSKTADSSAAPSAAGATASWGAARRLRDKQKRQDGAGQPPAKRPRTAEPAEPAEPADPKQRTAVELRRSPLNGRLYSKFRFFAHFGGYAEWDAAESSSTLNKDKDKEKKAGADADVEAAAADAAAKGDSERHSGIVKRWSTSHGFGFITPDGGGADVFVHVSSLPEDGYRLKEGLAVTYEATKGEDGKRRAAERSVRGPALTVDKNAAYATPQGPVLRGQRKVCVLVSDAGGGQSRSLFEVPQQRDGGKKGGFCFHCKQHGHYSRNCPTGGGEKGDIARKLAAQRRDVATKASRESKSK
eukprot:TRINITY_DN47511_c0_g1_i1.p1 TRINITY_DN47511_c0_g1~~TRINITY_DN47511_c0_g1_i1.p1  ORF type:complete len:423 (+),score=152.33 TRINITY_DN47511_c0_g1_i1:69-1271(+)